MKKRIALALLGALLVMASVPTVAYAQEESTESTENTNTLTPDKKPATTITKQINEDVYQVLDFDDVYSIIRDSNVASQNVARRNGMSEVDILIKYYRGVEMPHIVFRASRKNI